MNLKIIYNVYKSIDESIRSTFIIDVILNKKGNIEISIGADLKDFYTENPFFTLEEIVNTPFIYRKLNKKDKKFIQGLILAEGDLIIKNYNYENESFELASLIYKQECIQIKKETIKNSPYYSKRLNNSYWEILNENS